jgi:PAT family beta-lactamase induction signal transducer AmpG
VAETSPKLSTWQSLRASFASWRFGAVTLLSFPSGLPLGVVIITVPYWMQQRGVDIKTIGLITAAQIPYAFKFLWSPLIDRFAPRQGRKRFWILLSQAALTLGFLAFVHYADAPEVGVVAALTMLVSFASATQDIAIDAYAVEVLRKEEISVAVGARAALARAGLYVARIINTVGPKVGWPAVFKVVAGLFVPFAAVAYAGPEPEEAIAPPRSLRDAVWEPFVGFFRHSRAIEIAAFLFFYKYADNLATSLISPFFGQKGYSPIDVGLAQGSIGLVCTIFGVFLGGVLTQPWGLGRALWILGIAQALANLGYAVVAQMPVYRPVMYGSVALEAITSGMGTGAFGVFLLQLTQREFSATQYAFFSSIFALGRTFAGPPAGAMVDAMGWRNFFLFTPVAAIPGMWLLNRFAPWHSREVIGLPGGGPESSGGPPLGEPLTLGGLAGRSLLGGALGCFAALSLNVLLSALKKMHSGKSSFDLGAAIQSLSHPVRAVDYVDLVGPMIVGFVFALVTAAYLAARRGVGSPKANLKGV